MSFFNIPTRSHYSLGHAFSSPKQIFTRAIQLGHGACCVVDIHNLGSVVELLTLSKDKKTIEKAGLQRNHFPVVIGATINLCPDLAVRDGDNPANPVIVLAKNQEGYSNICELSSIATEPTEHEFIVPRISIPEVIKKRSGVILVDGGYNGYISKLIRNKDLSGAREYATQMKAVFGDDFYIIIDLVDVSKKWMPDQKKMVKIGFNEMVEINKILIQIADSVGVKKVVGMTSEMPSIDDLSFLQIHMKNVHHLKDGWEAQEARYLMSVEEIRARAKEKFPFLSDDTMSEMLLNVSEVQSKCENVELNFKPQIPKINYSEHPIQEKADHYEKLVMDWAHRAEKEDPTIKGLVEVIKKDRGILNGFMVCFYHNKIDFNHPSYRQRLCLEMKETQRNGKVKLIDYYLFLEDSYRIISQVKKYASLFDIELPPDAPEGYRRGNGRGSAGGSLIAYSMNITDLDPIKEGLLWERFITPDRLGVNKYKFEPA